MSLSNSLRAFLTVEWLHCSGGRSSSLGQLWRERKRERRHRGCGVEGDREGKMGRGKREEGKEGVDRDVEGGERERGEERA